MLTEAETKEIEKDITSIDVSRANFEHIAKTGKVNGTLMVDIKHLMTAMAEKKNVEIENLKSVMVAAAEEIQEHWQAHCDKEGYGPANLMHRLEKGIPSSYAYKAGDFAKLQTELDQVKAFIVWFNRKQFGFESDESAQSSIDGDFADYQNQTLNEPKR